MKQILVLTRMQLGGALDFLNMKRTKDRKKNVSATLVLFLGFLLFAFISGSYSFAMGTAMQQVGQIDVLPGFFMAVTSLIVLFTSVFRAKGILFGFKDYDILMSLPVKTSYIVASRLLQLYIIDMVFTTGIMLPCYVAYGILANPEWTFYLVAIIALFFIPLIPMILASILGVLLGYISSRFKHTNVVNIILMMLLLIAVFFGSFLMEDEQQLIDFSTIFRDKMNSLYPLAQWYNAGVIEYDMLRYVLFLLTSIFTFVLFSVLLGRGFKKLNTSIGAVYSESKYKMKELKQNSAFQALFFKEAKRYFGCSVYIMNTAFSLIIALIAAVGIHVVSMEEIDLMVNTPKLVTMIRPLLPFAVSLMVGMCAITASSISLEGKSLWIIKSSPVPAYTFLNSKIMLQNVLTMPVALITVISFMIKFKSSGIEAILSILLVIMYCYFNSIFGLLLNLKFPLLEWKNETTVVKQSAASMISAFSGIFTVGIPVACMFLIPKVTPIMMMGLTLVVFGVIALLLNNHLKKNGEAMIAKL